MAGGTDLAKKLWEKLGVDEDGQVQRIHKKERDYSRQEYPKDNVDRKCWAYSFHGKCCSGREGAKPPHHPLTLSK